MAIGTGTVKHCPTCACPALAGVRVTLDGKTVVIRDGRETFRLTPTGITGPGVPVWHRTASGYEQRLPDGQVTMTVAAR